MANQRNINLLRSSVSISPDVLEWERRLRLLSVIALFFVIGIGVTIGVLFGTVSSQKQSLEARKSRLLQQISVQSKKEALITNMKHRLGLLDRILATSRAWEPVLVSILEVAGAPKLQSLSISDKQIVSLMLIPDTLEDTKTMVDTIVRLSSDKKMRSPMLEALQIDRDGKIQAAVSFLPGF